MPKRGIHPFLNRLTYVLRNGASVELPSVMQSSKPILLQSVRRRAQAVRLPALFSPPGHSEGVAVQDPTSHPRWTGRARAAGEDEGRISQFAAKYEGFGGGLEAEEEARLFAPAQRSKPK